MNVVVIAYDSWKNLMAVYGPFPNFSEAYRWRGDNYNDDYSYEVEELLNVPKCELGEPSICEED